MKLSPPMRCALIEDTEQEKIRVAPEPAPAWWLKMMRTSDILELIESAPLAFALAAIIALRARFKPGFNAITGLNQGEAFLGDHEKYGMSMQEYRTAKKQLAKWGFATFTATSKGTTAKLTDTRLFDVLNTTSNKQPNKQPTNGQQQT
jgi:hypothetical protein